MAEGLSVEWRAAFKPAVRALRRFCRQYNFIMMQHKYRDPRYRARVWRRALKGIAARKRIIQNEMGWLEAMVREEWGAHFKKDLRLETESYRQACLDAEHLGYRIGRLEGRIDEKGNRIRRLEGNA